jgi:hypothetical protein
MRVELRDDADQPTRVWIGEKMRGSIKTSTSARPSKDLQTQQRSKSQTLLFKAPFAVANG